MPKRLTAMRLSAYTEQQLDTLAAQFGMTKTEVIQMAIDRLYQFEIAGLRSGNSGATDRHMQEESERSNVRQD